MYMGRNTYIQFNNIPNLSVMVYIQYIDLSIAEIFQKNIRVLHKFIAIIPKSSKANKILQLIETRKLIDAYICIQFSKVYFQNFQNYIIVLTFTENTSVSLGCFMFLLFCAQRVVSCSCHYYKTLEKLFLSSLYKQQLNLELCTPYRCVPHNVYLQN